MFARKGFVVPGRGENSGGDIEVFMRFGVTFVAVIFLVEAAPRPSPKAVPRSNSAGTVFRPSEHPPKAPGRRNPA